MFHHTTAILTQVRCDHEAQCAIVVSVMASSKLTDEFRIEFNENLQRKKATHSEKFLGGMDIMRKHKLVYTLDKVNCRFFLPHWKNRGGLMLSPYNVHRLVAQLHRVGADLKQIVNAVAVELAPNGNDRAKQLKANEQLVNRSKGLLAPINGEERF